MTISYDGSKFNGYQKQPRKKTVQGEIEKALKQINSLKPVKLVASGRTDAGVHAFNQRAHFDMENDIPLDRLKRSINGLISDSIYIKSIHKVDENFHARFIALSKTYKYLFLLRDESALWRNRAYCCGDLNVDKMRAAAELFLGEHDFTMLRSAGSEVSSTVRNVSMANISRCGDLAVFEVTADGFLYNMVRKMAAALKEVGEGKADKKRLQHIVDAKESFSLVAPPCGLYLWEVKYE